MRLAQFHVDLSRAGPGLLLRDIRRGEDPAIAAVLEILQAVEADVLVLQDFDYDAGHAALRALQAALTDVGVAYPHVMALRPNTGRPTGVDIDGDGRSHRPRDAHGYGLFNGQGGMAILSRFPFGEIRDFSDVLWADLPGSQASGVIDAAALDVLRLHSVGAWQVEVSTPSGALHVLTSHASPPVFDGPEDRNGVRNEDELLFWSQHLDTWNTVGRGTDGAALVLMGTFNVDPRTGEGRRGGLRSLLDHALLQDPLPTRPNGGFETVDWDEPDPGDLRVDYVLPGLGMTVVASGVLWPEETPLLGVERTTVEAASSHRLIWVDLEF